MIVVMKRGASAEMIQSMVRRVEEMGPEGACHQWGRTYRRGSRWR